MSIYGVFLLILHSINVYDIVKSTFLRKKQIMDKRPLILISNDDGYSAKGINFLAEVARQYGDVIVVAPDGPRSGASLAVTFHVPVTVSLIREEPGLKVYGCSGTPGDSIKMGMAQICPRRPDLVLAGINHGDNSAVNVHYSGTMGVVIEGCLKEIPSVGFSHFSHGWDTDFEPMRPYIEKVLTHVLAHGLPKGVCLNVNAPDTTDYKGMRICKMGYGIWGEEWEERISPRGWKYYWLVGKFDSHDQPDDVTDWNMMHQGYIAVTPTKIDITAYEAMEELEELIIQN